MSEVKVNKISPRTNCGTVTLGDSGDTFSIPAGVTLTNSGTATGFGPTGAVSWDTTKKTTGFTAVNGVGYFCDTTSAAFTMTLPSTPTAGNIIGFSDYAGTWDTNSPTIGRNGSNINGSASDFILTGENTSVTLIYVDSTKGWKVFPSGSITDIQSAQFVLATGGTITTCGDFKIHTFTGPGTFTVTNAGNPLGSNSVDYLVVAGGGGGGANGGGGGGAGGFRVSNGLGIPAPTMSPLANPSGLSVTAIAYPITVGAGGPAPVNNFPNPSTKGGNGNDSVFSTITSTGGGGGSAASENGAAGGSGGGGASTGSPLYPGFAGNTPPVSPPQGNTGGFSTGPQPANGYAGGGGGGAGAAGGNVPAPGQPAGPGGIGSFVSPSLAVSSAGTTGPSPGVRYFSGGGGGGLQTDNSSIPAPGGIEGGAGGGGPGVRVAGAPPAPTPFNGTAGTVNTGGGGGAGGRYDNGKGAAGGSGIVIIRYKFQ